MSYILGALSKAEKERKRDSGEELSDWDSKEWNAIEPSSGVGAGLKIVALLVVALLAAIFVLLWVLIGNLSSESVDSNPASPIQTVEQAALEVNPAIPNGAIDPKFRELEMAPELVDDLEMTPNEIATESRALAPDIPVITGHLYVPTNESLSRIFAESGSFRVGHLFEDGLKLVSISEDQAIFEWGDQSYEIPLGN